jgi:PAS domain S-box-containing protein
VVAASPVAIYILDAHGVVRLWNPAAERTFGWRTDDVLGQPLPIIPADKCSEFQEFLGRSIDGETLVDVELRRQKRDGSPIVIALSTAPLYDPSGGNRGVVSVAVDVSRRNQTEAEAREHRDADRPQTRSPQTLTKTTWWPQRDSTPCFSHDHVFANSIR